MRQRNEDIRVHNRLANLGLLDVLSALNWHERFVQSLEAVGYDDLAAGGDAGKTVTRGGLQMVERVFAVARVECVAVG
ncbi:hypothetical protein SDC9_70430 [bioreactor metagenome]|uniref:Uncharacterized protein n=1 Tax=bioreactor metagenome TaxID=1076179 RepID=A0A644YBM6_9ZZZZ